MKKVIFRFPSKLLLTMSMALLSQIFFAQNIRQFLDRVNSLPESERQVKVDSFMGSTTVLPLFEGDTACFFIYRGDAQSVKIAGDFTGWAPSWTMNNVSGTDLWYFPARFEADARLDYKFVINEHEWIPDPKNPLKCTGGYGTNSELRMPGYVVPPGITYSTDIAHGIIADTAFYSKKSGKTHAVKIYLPPGYRADRKYPMVLFHDGLEFISVANADNVLDWLIEHSETEPLIGVFVAPAEREDEFAGKKKDDYADFIVNDLLPCINKLYPFSKEPGDRANVGISNGGNIALYIGMNHPETFGKIAALSSNIEPVISGRFKNGPVMDLEIYLDVGTYDIPALIPLARDFAGILGGKNYRYQYHEWHEGHSWCSWKGHLSMVLKQFFPAIK